MTVGLRLFLAQAHGFHLRVGHAEQRQCLAVAVGRRQLERSISRLGTSCQQITQGDVIDVRVEAGCPTVTQ